MIEGDGKNWLNQIHRYDLVGALAHLIGAGEAAQVYNACDDTPITYNDYYTWCSRHLHKPMPPHGAVNPLRKRGLTNKQVSNAKLRTTGWTPIYPSFREGLVADCCDGV
jgi:nucleoside-diphosphate-sugar epimerase